MKAGIPERPTSRLPGIPITTHLSRCAKVTIWSGAAQYSLTTNSLASWASSLSGATYVAAALADNYGRIGLNVCRLAWHLELPLEWTACSRWCRSTSEADLGSLTRTFVSRVLRKEHRTPMFNGSIRQPFPLSTGSIVRISPRHELRFFNAGCFRPAPVPWDCSRKVN